MRMKRMWAMFKARNREFFRDRAAFGWNFLFPFLIVAGFGIIFSGRGTVDYKVGLFPLEVSDGSALHALAGIDLPDDFRNSEYISFIGFSGREEGLERLKHHKIDMLIALERPWRYYVSDTSPKGYVAEQIFQASLNPGGVENLARRERIQGSQVRYIDWLFPGILGMNMMFSALWGVGYVVVRYRKNGVLKRLKATPLTAFEYLSAQMLSRIFLLMFTLVVIWVGCDLIFSFRVKGSYLDLAVVFLLGSLSLTSLGLVLAARGTSEEFTTGALNFISWPMMFLSEVWFSIEGAPQWVKAAAKVFPLNHLLTAARGIITDGATLADVAGELTVLAVMTIAFLTVGAALFSWNR
jgi:ABC-type multidrug transport system permease subunit